jgi:hypothetical protein
LDRLIWAKERQRFDSRHDGTRLRLWGVLPSTKKRRVRGTPPNLSFVTDAALTSTFLQHQASLERSYVILLTIVMGDWVMPNMCRIVIYFTIAVLASIVASSGQTDLYGKIMDEGLAKYWDTCQNMKTATACANRCYAEFRGSVQSGPTGKCYQDKCFPIMYQCAHDLYKYDR